MNVVSTPLLLNAKSAAALSGFSRSGFYQRLSRGEVPAPVVVGVRRLWRVDDLKAWAQSLPQAEVSA